MSTESPPKPTTVTPNKKVGFIAIFISASGMGLVGTFSRLATPTNPETGVSYITGDFLALGRMAVGALGMLAIVALVKKLPELRRTKISFAVVAGGVCIGASLAFYVSATLMTTISNAVFLIYTGPLFSAILAAIFLKEKISRSHAVFLLLVFLGMLMTVGLLQYSGDTGLTFGLDLSVNPELPNKLMGDIFGLASGVFYGLALFFYRYRSDITSEVRSFWNFAFGIIGALVVMIYRMLAIDSTNPIEVMEGNHWAWAFVLFLVSGLLAIGLLPVAGKNLLAVELSTVAYWECVVALVLGVVIWSESMTAIGAIGGVLIIAGGIGPILIELARKRGGQKTPEEDAMLAVER